MKTVWRLLIKEHEVVLPWMIEKKRLGIGWGEIGDISKLRTIDAIVDAIRKRNESHPKHAGKHAANVQHGSKSLYDFYYTMKPGDLVIISDRGKRRHVFEVKGKYEYVEPSKAPLNYQHQRRAILTGMDPNELWQRAGGKLAKGQINFRTLGRCAEPIE
jgi:predicted Mrr-cat superfamily restriction endonuclease